MSDESAGPDFIAGTFAENLGNALGKVEKIC